MIYSDEYRKKCLDEKGRVCGNCGATTQIEVHHIDGDRSNNDLDNLIPLCRDCHSYLHRQDAIGQAAMELLEDFEPRDGPTLIELDRWILDFLNKHEYATPNLLLAKYRDHGEEASRQWFSDRLTRLEEHGHIEKVHPDTAERRLVSDPRAPEEPVEVEPEPEPDEEEAEERLTDDAYSCPDCGRGFETFDAMQEHIEETDAEHE